MGEATANDDTTQRTSPSGQLLELLYTHVLTPMLSVVAELEIADLLTDGPRPVADLATATETNADALYRVMRTLASYGVFTEIEPRTFALTPLAAALRANERDSMRHMALYLRMKEHHEAFGALLHSVRTGKPAFDHLFGTDFWSYLADHPDLDKDFNTSMGAVARQVQWATIAGYDFTGVTRVVDVGGGQGQLATELLRNYPHMTAVVFDRPQVIADATANPDVADRITFVSGDFFEAVPSGGDFYLLSNILHDWDDASATRILRNVAHAMGPESRVAVVDPIIPEDELPHFSKLLDITMLVMFTGRERTESELVALFDAVGLTYLETHARRNTTSMVIAARKDTAGLDR